MTPSRNSDRSIAADLRDGDHEDLFAALGDYPQEQPSRNLRAEFYRRLRQGEGAPWWRPRWLSRQPWIAALATLVAGIAIGIAIPGESNSGKPEEMALLNARLTTLNRTVALALLDNRSANERLRGVEVASELVGADPDMTWRLLQTADRDPVASVRSAAIEALGPSLDQPEVAAEVRRLLTDTDSVLVQMALADLIMRWGDDEQILALIRAADEGLLHDDVRTVVLRHVRRVSA